MNIMTKPWPGKRGIWKRTLAMRWTTACMSAWFLCWFINLFTAPKTIATVNFSYMIPPHNLYLAFIPPVVLAYYQSTALSGSKRPHWPWFLAALVGALFFRALEFLVSVWGADLSMDPGKMMVLMKNPVALVLIIAVSGFVLMAITGLFHAWVLRQMGVRRWWMWPIWLGLSLLAGAVVTIMLGFSVVRGLFISGMPEPVFIVGLSLFLGLTGQAVFGMFSGAALQSLLGKMQKPVPWTALVIQCGVLCGICITLSLAGMANTSEGGMKAQLEQRKQQFAHLDHNRKYGPQLERDALLDAAPLDVAQGCKTADALLVTALGKDKDEDADPYVEKVHTPEMIREEAAAAEAGYRECLKQDPEFAPAITGLANALILQGKYDQAGELLEPLQARMPESLLVSDALGDLAFARGNLEEAKTYYEAAFKKQEYEPFLASPINVWVLAQFTNDHGDRIKCKVVVVWHVTDGPLFLGRFDTFKDALTNMNEDLESRVAVLGRKMTRKELMLSARSIIQGLPNVGLDVARDWEWCTRADIASFEVYFD